MIMVASQGRTSSSFRKYLFNVCVCFCLYVCLCYKLFTSDVNTILSVSNWMEGINYVLCISLCAKWLYFISILFFLIRAPTQPLLIWHHIARFPNIFQHRYEVMSAILSPHKDQFKLFIPIISVSCYSYCR